MLVYMRDMKFCRSLVARFCLVLALLVALGASGFAHRAATPAPDEALLAYVQAGGSLSEICADEFEGGHAEKCDACRLADCAAVPLLRGGPYRTERTATSAGPLAPIPVRPHFVDPSRLTRAPPFV